MAKAWYTTHPQPHKPLLVGWIVGGLRRWQRDRAVRRGDGETKRKRGRGPLVATFGRNAGPNDAIVVWALCKFFFVCFLFFINLLICFFCCLGSNLLVTTDRGKTTQTHQCRCQPPPPCQNGMRGAVLYTPPPVLLDSDRTARSPSGSEWSPSGVQSDSVHSIELYFEVYFPSGVRVESEQTNLLNAVEAICKSLLCCDISPIGLHSDWIGTYNLMLKLVSENVKAWFWQALNPHPLH